MNSNLLVSIIVPVYNVESYLCECVNSIINQSYQNLDIILVDDGSTDNCPIICDSFAKKDKRISVLHKSNGGLSDARNYGILFAKGKWISFIDSDDLIAPTMIEQMIQSINPNLEESIVLCKNRDFYNTNELSFQTIKKEAVEMSYNEITKTSYYVTAWGKLFPISFFDDVVFPIGKLHEDIYTTYKLFDKAKKIFFINEALYYYRQRGNSISNTKKIQNYLDTFEALFERYNYFNSKNNNYQKQISLIQLSNYFVDLVNSKRSNLQIQADEFKIIKKRVKKEIKYKNRYIKNYRVSFALIMPHIFFILRKLKKMMK